MVFQAEGSNIRLHNECSKKYEGSGILLSFLAGGGGLIGNSAHGWIQFFSRAIGITSSVIA